MARPSELALISTLPPVAVMTELPSTLAVAVVVASVTTAAP